MRLSAIQRRYSSGETSAPPSAGPDDRPLRLEVVGNGVLPLGVPLAEVLGENLAAAAGDPVDTRVAQPGRSVGVTEPGPVGKEDELRNRQRVELDPVAVALADSAEQVGVVVERELRIEASVETDEVAAGLDQLVDLREHVFPGEDVAAVLVRKHVEGAVVALGDADVRVVDDPHHHVGGVIRPVPARAHCLRARYQFLVGGVQPEVARLVHRDPAHAGTASSSVTSSGASTSMNELTEKTALPAPAMP
jgi:hypothetical protein